MNKHLKGIFCIPLAAIKYVILKLTHMTHFYAEMPAIISPLTEITVDSGAQLSIGRNLKMHNGAKIRVRKKANVKIGSNFGMSNGCVVTAYEKITIGDDVMLGPNVLIYDQDHDYKAEGGVSAMKFKTSPITIGNNVWIGANTIILRGTIIGDYCVIGAGAILKGNYGEGKVVIQKKNEMVKDSDINI